MVRFFFFLLLLFYTTETLPVHQLRRTLIAAPRGQGIDAQFTSRPNNIALPEKCQKGIIYRRYKRGPFDPIYLI